MFDPNAILAIIGAWIKDNFISTISTAVKNFLFGHVFFWLGLLSIVLFADPIIKYFHPTIAYSMTLEIALVFTFIYFLLRKPIAIRLISSHAGLFIGPAIIWLGSIIFFKLFGSTSDNSIVGVIILGYIALYAALYDKNNRRMISLIVGYVFVLGTLILIGYFFVNDFSEQDRITDGNGRKYNNKLIQVLPGCDFSHAFIEINEKGEPKGLARDKRADIPRSAKYCGRLPPQWSVSIGGLVLDCYVDGRCPWQLKNEQILEACENLKAKPDCINVEDTVQENKDKALRIQIQALENYKQARDNLTSAQLDNAYNIEQLKSIVSDRKVTLEQANESLKSAEQQLKEHNKKMKEAVIEKHNFPDSRLIVGGIVIPVYFFILAMAGSLVSMARKLPEFQARSNREYTGDYREKRFHTYDQRPPIHQSQVSEYVIFQMLQVITTLPIAVVAYAYIRPENMASNILLGFAAGYSSEIFLMAVRKFSDALVAQRPESILAMTQEKVVKLEKENEMLKAKNNDYGLGLDIEGKLYHLGDVLELREKVEDHPEGTIVLLYQFATGEGEIIAQVANNLEKLKVSKAQLRPINPQKLAFEAADEGLI